MSSLYGFYIKERENAEIIENDDGFITYQIRGDEVFIRDFYVVPPRRKTRVAFNLGQQLIQVAKAQGCRSMVATVFPLLNGSQEALKIFMKYGMKITACRENCIFLAGGI